MAEVLSKYLVAEEALNRGRKTKRWGILSKSSRALLGTVEWLGRWRQYCFFPAQGTIFNAACLHTIIGFLDRENTAHRRALKENKGGERGES